MMTKKIIFGATIAFAILLLVSFRLAKNGVGNKRQAQKITVLLDWFPNTNHTGLYVAKKKGYFTTENLNVDILQLSGGDPVQTVATGKADFGISSQESVTMARASGIPVVSIAAIIQHNTSAFASLKEANILSVKDFEEKRYGGWGSPIEETVIRAVMTDAGADYSKLKNITIGETDFFKTIGKESDFQWIFYGWDGIEAKRRGVQLTTIFLKDLNPVLDYYTPVIITNEDHLENKKDVAQRFMKAVQKGYEFSIQHPQEAAEILIHAAPEINADLARASQKWVSQQYQAEANVWGIQKEEVWKRYAQWLFDHTLIEKMPEEKKAFTNEFLYE